MMRWLLSAAAVLVVVIAGLGALVALSPVTASRLLWPAIEAFVLRHEFIGMTSDGTIERGLFHLEETGVSTEAEMTAANRLIETLSPPQQQALLFEVDDLEWRRWANIHISHRQGVGLLDMDRNQQGAATGLLGASLSKKGFATAENIIKLEGHLADLKDNHVEYGEGRYWFTVMGEPSREEPWGWQVDGHHLVINYFVLGDQVVATPMFMGSEPTRAADSRFGPLSVFEEETDRGLALVNSLDENQRSMAIIEQNKTGNNARGELFQDNATVPYEGILLKDLSEESQTLARELIRTFIGRLKEPRMRVKLEEIEQYWSKTYFAWIGQTSEDGVFYYRIHSPVVMIEYDHQMPVALDGPDEPTRSHVHTVIRTPNGNDYGKDLLRQHLAAHPHQAPR